MIGEMSVWEERSGGCGVEVFPANGGGAGGFSGRCGGGGLWENEKRV